MIIYDLAAKTLQPEFWHALPRKWAPDTYVQGQAIACSVVRNGLQREVTFYLRDAASVTFAQFLQRWGRDDQGIDPAQAEAYYRQWWSITDSAEPVRVFRLSATEIVFRWDTPQIIHTYLPALAG